MDRLKTARVVVIDDKPEEAMPMIVALGRLGIGCIHLDGIDQADLPKAPYQGVRLAFVDMDLDVGGGGGARPVIAKTIAVFRSVVSSESSPCVVVAWTKHDDYVTAFEEALRAEMPELRPAVVIRMEKPQDAEDISIKDVLRKITTLLKKQWPVDVIWGWEQLVHDAVTDTTRLVSQVAAKELEAKADGDKVGAETWNKALHGVLKGLVHAAGGSVIAPKMISSSLVESLNSVLLDSMEQYIDVMDRCETDKLIKTAELTEQAKLHLNTRLLTAKVREGDAVLRPGNVYLTSWSKKPRRPVPRVEIVPSEVLSDFAVKWTKDRAYREQKDTLDKLERQDRPEATEARRALQRLETQLRQKLRCAVVEVTPVCDFAQGRSRVVRFVGGLLVPDELTRCFAECKAPYFKRVKAVQVDQDEEPCELILNAHFVYSRSMPVRGSHRAAFRLRGGVVTDVQHWLSTHSSRPGILVVD
jgi:hypothetical protein